MFGADPLAAEPVARRADFRLGAHRSAAVKAMLDRFRALLDAQNPFFRDVAALIEQAVGMGRAMAPFIPSPELGYDLVDGLEKQERKFVRKIRRLKKPIVPAYGRIAKTAPEWRAEAADLLRRFDDLGARWPDTLADARWRFMIYQSEIGPQPPGPVFDDPGGASPVSDPRALIGRTRPGRTELRARREEARPHKPEPRHRGNSEVHGQPGTPGPQFRADPGEEGHSSIRVKLAFQHRAPAAYSTSAARSTLPCASARIGCTGGGSGEFGA